MTVSDDMSIKEILNDFNENYGKIHKLLDEDSKNDPENEPYMSKYKAKKILVGMCDKLKKMRENQPSLEDIKIQAMIGVVLLNIGTIEMDTEELAASEKTLTEAAYLLTPDAKKPEIVITLVSVYNGLGILWSNRDSPATAKAYLLQAREVYENFKCTLQMPMPIEQILSSADDNIIGDIMQLEKAHTLTLYYLAQVYGVLKENVKSAVYCHVTLRRQLQYKDYDPIDWALNSATLSQVFGEQNGFYQARHHLAAASAILDQYEEKLNAETDNDEIHLAKVETFKHRSADVARCWAKYCILLMAASKTRLLDDGAQPPIYLSDIALEDEENICGGDITQLVFPDIDVTKYESTIGDQFLLTYPYARQVFLTCQTWLNKAKEYYKLDTLASDYIEIIQDASQSFSFLAFFEEDDERRARMHKRRVDMLEELLKQINPVYYVQHCRHLWYELAETYSDILAIKLDKVEVHPTEKLTPQALKKINMLCEKSIECYEDFLNTVRDKDGKMPLKIASNLIRPVINALAYIGRNSMKRRAIDKEFQLAFLQKSYDSYKAVVDICAVNVEAEAMMREECHLCQEMIEILPIKINKLQQEIAYSK